ncbi:sulfotransferase family protein [Flexithrix dorotheae]|uniref:sulfotransferase family protein n=1 Tax=Flexithrix dorotheae TaxID=70993 RepID=UPI00036B212D|nr:sulfotransferase [Flexithrix dorotheae]
MQTKAELFRGPLIIVGLPRSGTKLLRDLLNQNPSISIPEGETHFIPALIKKFKGNPPKNQEELTRFFKMFTQVNFYHRMKKLGIELPQKQFLNSVNQQSWESIFGFILRFYSPKGLESKIYGDKTPQYLRYLELLKQTFPKAKFIHIVRDPRDYCISIKNIWGKNMFRAAYRWKTEIQQAHFTSEKFPDDFLEIQYEKLLENPEKIMRKICDFVSCSFDENMLSLAKPAENYGDAKDSLKIVSGNFMKYKSRLKTNELKKIEEIAFNQIVKSNYTLEIASKSVEPTRLQLFWYQILDIISLLNFHVKEKGLQNGINFILRNLRFKI